MTNTSKYENVKMELFESKEHYLEFRQSWKDYINSGKAKRTYVKNDDGYLEKGPSNLDSKFHLLFCILIERDLSKAFKGSPTGRKNEFDSVVAAVTAYCRMASKLSVGNTDTDSDSDNDRRTRLLNTLNSTMLHVFNGTVTVEMLGILYTDYLSKVKLVNTPSDIMGEAA